MEPVVPEINQTREATTRPSRGRRSATRVTIAMIGALFIAFLWANPASAAPSHHVTDPYRTGCTSGAFVIGSRSVPGGTIRVFSSPRCGTNWVEYQGINQWTSKTTSSYSHGTPGIPEMDVAPWSYSMQVYAPGTTSIGVQVKVQGKTFNAICNNGCRWF